ncbi:MULTISPECIES: acyl carrier protein [Streptomyces]|uniref:Phosphopantetheine-binding protein n=1 Tax=Streptomyces ramulosus TaxID=47762 RepID=A0ABW1FB77_9ACTN
MPMTDMPTTSNTTDIATVADWILSYLGEELSVPVSRLAHEATFSSLGLTSQDAVTMVSRLGLHLGRAIPVATLWAFPTVNGLAAAAVSEKPDAGVPGSRHVADAQRSEPLTVVSMAARLPGADSVTQLWELLHAGGDAIGPPPPGRFPHAGEAVPDAGYPGRRAPPRAGTTTSSRSAATRCSASG